MITNETVELGASPARSSDELTAPLPDECLLHDGGCSTSSAAPGAASPGGGSAGGRSAAGG